MNTSKLDPIRAGVLTAMERQAALVRAAVLGAAFLEILMLAAALLVLDWHDRTHLLMLILAVLGYSVVILGLVALGSHMSRSVGQLALALQGQLTDEE